MKRIIIFLFLLSACISLQAQSSDYLMGFERAELVQLSNGRSWTANQDPSVFTTLMNNHAIRDPYQGIQEDSLKWVYETAWEYRLIRHYTPLDTNKHLDFVVSGINTDADIFVNRIKVVSCHNQFRQYRVNVKPYMKGHDDTIAIRLYPSSIREKAQAAVLHDTLPGDERVFTRRAAYQYGWDFGPRFLDMTIGRFDLHSWNDFYLDDTWVRTVKADTAKAQLEISLDVYCAEPGNYKIGYEIEKAKAKSIHRQETLALKKGMNTLRFRQTIRHPKLWWCRGYGDPALYWLDLAVSDPHGISSGSRDLFGIRTIALEQAGKPDSAGFAFILNGVPVFAKGANVIPTDMFNPAHISEFKDHLPKLAAGMNMNMLRIWGGGVYANDYFMRDCDENGILVWQDLMFACAMYPGDTGFVNNVSEEVAYQVKRLRGHPSLALWCGNNEIEEGWYNWGWQKQYRYSIADSTRIWQDYQHLFREVIPGIIHKADPDHAYWPSSPSNGWGRTESMIRGDAHYWGVWWGMEPFSTYERKVPRFMSEYGFQSLPGLSTWKICCPDSMLYIGSPCLKAHQKHPAGYQTIDAYLARDLVVPQKLEDYIYASQFLQAWGVGKAVEAHRRARPYCMGTLFWQLNDCWPGATWSAIDYYGRRKYLAYHIRRLYEPKLISGFIKNRRYCISLINDEREACEGNLTVTLKTMDGRVIWKKELAARAPAAGVAEAWSFPVDSLLGNDSAGVYIDMKMTGGKDSLERIGYLVSPGRLKLQKPHITVKYAGRAFVISSDKLVPGLHMERKNNEGITIYENFTDLQPGGDIVIPGYNIKNKDWIFYSLYDLLKATVREPLKK